MKEGSISTMWRLNISNIHQMLEQDSHDEGCEWELVETMGRGPGRISHHTSIVRQNKEVYFYGGLKNEDSNSEIFLFNLSKNEWVLVNFSVSSSLTSRVNKHDFAVTNCD